MGREEFRLLHYAGEVNYNVNGEMSQGIGPRGHMQGGPVQKDTGDDGLLKGLGSNWRCSCSLSRTDGISLLLLLFLSGFLDKNNDLLFRNLKEVRVVTRRKDGQGHRYCDTGVLFNNMKAQSIVCHGSHLHSCVSVFSTVGYVHVRKQDPHPVLQQGGADRQKAARDGENGSAPPPPHPTPLHKARH